MSHASAAATVLDRTPVHVPASARDRAPAQGVRHRGERRPLARFDQHHLDDLVDPGRRNVAKKRFGLF